MLGLAGIPLGLEFAFLDPSEDAPAAAVGDLIVAGLDDESAARKLAERATVATYEWEGVPADTARAAGTLVPVHPSPTVLEISQDRLVEKQTFVVGQRPRGKYATNQRRRAMTQFALTRL